MGHILPVMICLIGDYSVTDRLVLCEGCEISSYGGLYKYPKSALSLSPEADGSVDYHCSAYKSGR